MSQFCEKCGQPLPAGARFCEKCGEPVEAPADRVALSRPESLPATPPPPPPALRPSSGGLPKGAILLAALALLCFVGVVMVAGGALVLQQSGVFRGPATLVAATGIPSPVGPEAALAASPPPTLTSMPAPALTFAVPALTFPAPTVTTIPAPTQTSVPTPSPTLAPAPTLTPAPTSSPPPVAVYDLYVRRITVMADPSQITAGSAVKFNVLLATDTFPPSGPFFPTARFRWRPGVQYDWAEALCPANSQAASCDSTFEFTYSQSGAYDFEVQVDSRGEVAEINEGNNTGRVTVNVQAARPTTAPPTTAPAGPRYGAVTFSSGFDETNQVPVNAGKSFAYGAKIIYAYWTYSGVTPGTPYEYQWYRNGARVDSSGNSLVNSSGKTFDWLVIGYTPSVPLEAGNYQYVATIGGKVIQSDSFTIQAPAVGGPIAGAISVFFTIQNGEPTGWVYDKQGVRHTPQSRTISGITVVPGDRIVLRTDTARFSALFDCSTTAGTFSPCNWSADSASNLPGELRAIKSGMSGFLNISRADNWAGFRPGFEPQRYPADPVLRIVFNW